MKMDNNVEFELLLFLIFLKVTVTLFESQMNKSCDSGEYCLNEALLAPHCCSCSPEALLTPHYSAYSEASSSGPTLQFLPR